MKFHLKASVSSDRPAAVKSVLEQRLPGARLEPLPDGFAFETDLEGPSARDLNRSLLTALRAVEKKTRLRSEWTSGTVTEKFFDYVPKGVKDSSKP